jgi:hypothetical protein
VAPLALPTRLKFERSCGQCMKRIASIVFAIGVINFAAFVVIGLSIGGSAMNGKVEDGKYYVGNHGRYMEVSRSVFDYSLLHGYSTIVTHAFMFVAVGVMFWQQTKRKKTKKNAAVAIASYHSLVEGLATAESSVQICEGNGRIAGNRRQKVWLKPGLQTVSLLCSTNMSWGTHTVEADVELEVEPGYCYCLSAQPMTDPSDQPRIEIRRKPAAD